MAGLLDFLNTPQGTGLLSGLAGYAMNARRGTPVNNIGRGLAAGLQGYQGYYDNQQKDAYNKAMSEAAMANAVTARQRAMNEALKAQKDKEDDDLAGNVFKTLFEERGYSPETGQFVQVSSDATPVTLPVGKSNITSKVIVPEQEQPVLGSLADPDMSYVPPKPPNPMDEILGELNWTPGRKKMFEAQYKANPAAAMKTLQSAYVELDRANRKGRSEARDVIAKEKAYAEAMGVPLGQYLREKSSKSGVNVNVQNIMPGEAAEMAGKKEGMEIGEQAAAIENKFSAVDSVREAKDMLHQGIYSGYWGDIGKTVAKASLGAVGDRQKAARTEQFMAYIGNTVVPRLKEFGGNDSNEEMRYLQRIMGGDITMEPESLAAILDSAERKILRGIERLQRQRGALEQGQMPDLGPGPSRGQTQKTQVKPLPNKAPSVDDLLKKYGR